MYKLYCPVFFIHDFILWFVPDGFTSRKLLFVTQIEDLVNVNLYDCLFDLAFNLQQLGKYLFL